VKNLTNNLKDFQKIMWSNPKPLNYAVEAVEGLLKENLRLRTVMLEALHEIDSNLDSHLGGENENKVLFHLLDNLCLKGMGIYLSHLSEEDLEYFRDSTKSLTNFDKLES
jgi:hypothetical protein|tara:strand:+ start:408 stop:737 length:330 start_codon:yes stop_codon:yes gene_type:complete